MQRLFFMHLNVRVKTALISLACLCTNLYPSFLFGQTAEKSPAEFEKLARVPVPKPPFLFIDPEEIAAARKLADTDPWARSIKENYKRIADQWLARDYAFVKKIIPAKGAIYVYGLGRDLDPVGQKKMKWRGWSDPRHVQGANGDVYPNNTHPDNGRGWKDNDGRMYYFEALANGMTIHSLEATDLPALANTYLLTGNEAYAERALWLLDAIAEIYPRAYEGPIDYPGNEPGKPDGGRLDRPYYQAARALMNYAFFAEVLAPSIHASEPSPTAPAYSLQKHIELNLLMNGADYCLRMARSGKGASFELNNGNIDYNRAPLAVGAMLGIPEWIDWALNGPLGFKNALSNTIDINGRYFETGTLYAGHTRELFLSTAFFLKRMRTPAYPNGYPAFDDTRFSRFTLDFFTGIQVAGRLPLYGDSGPDRTINSDGRIFDKGTLFGAWDFYRYATDEGIRKKALQKAGQMLADKPAGHTFDASQLFDIDGWDAFAVKAKAVPQENVLTRSPLFFDNGVLALKSGKRESERAALLRFGPTLNHGQADELGLAFYALGRDFSFDPGYYNTHYRFGFTTTTVAHNLLVVNRRNQLRQAAPGGDVQSWTDGSVIKSTAVNNPQAYAGQGVKLYKRRVAVIDVSVGDSYLVDNFWARGGKEYDYSLHGPANVAFNVSPAADVKLRESRKGSVLNAETDYAYTMDANGRVTSFADKPFYFAPPGDGFGYLGHPSFFDMKEAVQLQWLTTDGTGHNMYVAHFAPSGAELITAKSVNPSGDLTLSYALSHMKAKPSETVRFTSVILNTKGPNKLASVKPLRLLSGNKTISALQITPAGKSLQTQEHFYFAADTLSSATFEEGISFSGEEGFLGLEGGKVNRVSLTGPGKLQKDGFTFTVAPFISQRLEILKVEEQPLRVLVNVGYEKTRQLTGSILKLNRPGMARPFTLRVEKAEASGQNSWIILDASDNVHAIGTVKSYDPKTNSVITDSPFPHTRAYTYNYTFETGNAGGGAGKSDYNGGYNGFWLTVGGKSMQIRTIEDKRTKIVLESTAVTELKAGDKFEIRLLLRGDKLETTTWGEAKRVNGKWISSGPGMITVKE